MIIRNTSKYSTEEMKKLIDFVAKGFNHKNICLNIKNSGSAYRGRAYRGIPAISNAPKSSQYLVVVAIGTPDKFPVAEYYSNQKYKRLIPVTFETWQEAFVSVLAHELRHIYQFRNNKPCSEVDASKIGYKKLMEYRKLNSN